MKKVYWVSQMRLKRARLAPNVCVTTGGRREPARDAIGNDIQYMFAVTAIGAARGGNHQEGDNGLCLSPRNSRVKTSKPQ